MDENALIKLLQSNDDPKIIDIFLENRDTDENYKNSYSYYDEFYHTFHRVAPEHMVALYGCLPTLNSLLELSILDINAKSSYGYTMLHYACVSKCVSNRLDIVRRLLEIENLDTEATNMFGQTAFNIAVFKGSDELIQLLVTHGVNINASSPTGHALYIGRDADRMDWSGSSLMDTIQYRRKNIFDMLIDLGADVNIRNLHGQTPLHFAIMFGSGKDTIRTLLEHGADVNSNNPTGFEWNKSPLSWVEHEKPWDGGSPLAYAVKIKFNQTEIIKLLLDWGADVNNINVNNGMSILMESCNLNCSLDTFELLIESGADPNTMCHYANTLFMTACKNNAFEIAKYIFERFRPDLERRNHLGQTALNLVASKIKDYHVCVPIVSFLLDSGADINASSPTGNSIEIFGLAKPETWTGGSILLESIPFSGMVSLLLDRGADVNQRDIHGQTSLHKMSPYLQEHFDFESIIIKLLDKGADINSQDNSGQTLLHLIAGSRYSDKIKINKIRFLLDRGADPNICNFSNQIPLHLYVSGNIDLFKLFLDRGANIFWKDINGQSPVYLYSILLQNQGNNIQCNQFREYIIKSQFVNTCSCLELLSVYHHLDCSSLIDFFEYLESL
jgi:ankyrin repeat protein